ncbi:MAG: ATP-dependent DNA helicase RecG [Candidatus Shapirobacteria bacterium]|nr:ATP-dependent DNA helicase RecG [Candidatus Shapirobacteria bacterium]
MEWGKPVSQLFMIGPAYAKKLRRLNIFNVGDFLYHFPFRYHDYSLVSLISQVQVGEIVTISGKLKSLKNIYTRYGKKIQKAEVEDKTGKIEITWFNQPFLINVLKIGEYYNFSGKIDFFGNRKVMVSPEYEIKKEELTHTGRLTPVYPETSGITSKWLRTKIAWLLKNLEKPVTDFLPEKIKKENDLLEINQALKNIHFPESLKIAQEARKRFAFEELFLVQLKVLKRKIDWRKKKLAYQFTIDQEKILGFNQNLPFEMTSAQKKVCQEIISDLSSKEPMNRLLEGDVGSGKTVVAALAIFISWLNNTKSILMAPTEILANQHYQTLKKMLEPLGVKIGLLTSSNKKPIANEVLVGTHALLFNKISLDKLGLVIIDEQHRFGVKQRSQLLKKTGKGQKTPHLLTMTATPIPRSIALTLYGDLDLSVIDEMPVGRQKVKTWVVPPQKREAAYQWLKKQIKDNAGQCFLVCPFIDISETLQTVKAAKDEYEKLAKNVFPDLRLGLLHGKMKSQEKETVLEKFRQRKIDLLVTTPVVEVGIDIPQATIIVIEGAERFGLSQLHQLRGRVGRNQKESYCLLFSNFTSGKTFERIKALEKINVGFKLAELDLKLRGPGEVYGISQHGFFDLKTASFNDIDLLEKAKKAAEGVMKKIKQYPLLQEKIKEDTIKNVEAN